MQEYPQVGWVSQAQPWWTLGRIRDNFCSDYDLDTTAFCLYCIDAVLCMGRLVSEVGGHAVDFKTIGPGSHGSTAIADS